jgi:hypothetical protein
VFDASEGRPRLSEAAKRTKGQSRRAAFDRVPVTITAADLAGGSITNIAVAHAGGVDSNANVPSAAATVRPGLPPAVSGKHATAPTTAPAAQATPVPQATTIHTGEPWIAAGPWIMFFFGLGTMLIDLGTLLRRRAGARR